jgi:hypothetical protein
MRGLEHVESIALERRHAVDIETAAIISPREGFEGRIRKRILKILRRVRCYSATVAWLLENKNLSESRKWLYV